LPEERVSLLLRDQRGSPEPGAEQPPKDHTRLERTTWVPFSDGTCSVTS
jgi:hypothetical protein